MRGYCQLRSNAAHYAVDDLQAAMANLVLTQIRRDGKLEPRTSDLHHPPDVNEMLLRNSTRPPIPGSR